MTAEQLQQAFTMRMRGKTYADIAEKLQLDKRVVANALRAYIRMLETGLGGEDPPPGSTPDKP